MVSNTTTDVQKRNGYPWIELGVENQTGRLDRNRFTRCDDTEALKTWRNAHHNKDVFASSCHFSEPGRDTAYVCGFFLELKASTIATAREDSLRSCDLMSKLWGVDPPSFDICFDGNRAFYVVVPRRVFGDPEGAEIMTVYRNAARHIRDECAPHIDLSVYQPSHMHRLGNSVNSRTDLHVVALKYNELADLSPEDVLSLAIWPREQESTALPAVADKAVAWIHEATEKVRQASRADDSSSAEVHRGQTSQSHRAARAARRMRKRARNQQKRAKGQQLLLFDNSSWR